MEHPGTVTVINSLLSSTLFISLILVYNIHGRTAVQDSGSSEIANIKPVAMVTKDRSIFCTTDVNGDRMRRRKKRYAYVKYSDGRPSIWDSDTVTWGLTRPSRQIPVAQQKEIIKLALSKWSAVTPLIFNEERGSRVPDINIIFARGSHGPAGDPVFDGKARPGKPNSLGHAWGPGTDRSTQNGDVHFDEDDEWTDEIKFLGVAIHELGHSLGLSHSEDAEAVMFPAYREMTELANDDINGAQFLYGNNRQRPRTPRPATTPRSRYRGRSTMNPRYRRRSLAPDRRVPTAIPIATTLRPDSPCRTGNIKVVEDPFSDIPGFLYIIINDTVYHVMPTGERFATLPFEHVFPGAPTNPDVVFTLPEKKSIFIIKDQQMWQFNGEGLVGGKSISLHTMKFPETPWLGITLSDMEGNRRVYLFGRNYWWNIDVDNIRSTRHYEIGSFSRDFPARDVRIAMQLYDDRLYAVTEDSYIVIDLYRRSKIHGESSSGRPELLNRFCQSSSSALQTTYSILAVTVTVTVTLAWRNWLH